MVVMQRFCYSRQLSTLLYRECWKVGKKRQALQVLWEFIPLSGPFKQLFFDVIVMQSRYGMPGEVRWEVVRFRQSMDAINQQNF